MRARGLPAALLALTTAVAALSGCAQSVDPIERLGKKAAERVHPQHRDGPEANRRGGRSAPTDGVKLMYAKP